MWSTPQPFSLQSTQALWTAMESAISKRRRLFAGSSVPSRMLSQLILCLRQAPDMEELLNIFEYQLSRAIPSFWPDRRTGSVKLVFRYVQQLLHDGFLANVH